MISNEDLVKNLIERDVLKTENIIEAFKKIDRKDFLPEGYKRNPYVDSPIPIGQGQTNSQPTTVAFMLELLRPKKGDDILDIGCGSGWTTALLGKITGEEGTVIGLEIILELVEFGKANLKKYDLGNSSIKQAKEGKLGLPGKEFDKILVSASAKEIPVELYSQLKSKGVMVAPVKNSIFKFTKTNGKITKQEHYGFSFVPLITY